MVLDENVEKLLERSKAEIFEQDLFNLMIPFSQHYLKKVNGEAIFGDEMTEQPKTFEFTISKKSTGEEISYDGDDITIYKKMYQTLSAIAYMVDFTLSEYDDFSKMTEALKMIINPSFSEAFSKEMNKVVPICVVKFKPVEEIQKFKYSLLNENRKSESPKPKKSGKDKKNLGKSKRKTHEKMKREEEYLSDGSEGSSSS